MYFFLDIPFSELIFLLIVSNSNSYSSFTHQTTKRRISNEQTRTYRSDRHRQWIDKSRSREGTKLGNFKHHCCTDKERQSDSRRIWHFFNIRPCRKDRTQSANRRIYQHRCNNSSKVQSRKRIESGYQRLITLTNSLMKTAGDLRPLFFYYSKAL